MPDVMLLPETLKLDDADAVPYVVFTAEGPPEEAIAGGGGASTIISPAR